MGASGTVKLTVNAKYSQPGDIATPDADFYNPHDVNYVDGNGQGQLQVWYAKKHTIAGSGNVELDLAGGVTDDLGNTVTFTEIKVLKIKNPSTNTTNLLVGGAAANAWAALFSDASDELVIPPGMVLAIDLHAAAAGLAVTAGTGDILRLENAGGSELADAELILGGVGSLS